MVSGLQSSRLPSSRLTFLSICNNMRVYITKIYIIIRKYSIIKFFNHFTRNKPLKNKFLMLANKNRQLCHTFFGSCIIKAIFYHESLFTFLESYTDHEQNQILKDKYQLFYHTFLETYSIQEQNKLQKDKHQKLYCIFCES